MDSSPSPLISYKCMPPSAVPPTHTNTETSQQQHQHQNSNFDYLFKIVLVGDTGVGKSSLLLRYADHTFNERMMATIGVDFRIRTIDIDGKTAKLQIWDSAGQERFRSLTSSYYRGAHAVAVVFDLSSFDSINTVSSTWLDEINSHCPKNIRRILIGNKSDMHDQRQVSKQHALAAANSLNMLYIETSAKTAQNVHQAFETVVRSILKNDAQTAPLDNDGEQSTWIQQEEDADDIRLSDIAKQSPEQKRNRKKCC